MSLNEIKGLFSVLYQNHNIQEITILNQGIAFSFYLNEFFRIFMVVDMLAVGQGLDLLSPYNVIKLGSRSVGLKLLLFFIK